VSDLLEDLKAELRSLTVEQLADAMGIEKWRVYELVKKGNAPPSFKVGKTYRFPIAGVRKWFADQTSN
jgi:excisionase family DNA binding protein